MVKAIAGSDVMFSQKKRRFSSGAGPYTVGPISPPNAAHIFPLIWARTILGEELLFVVVVTSGTIIIFISYPPKDIAGPYAIQRISSPGQQPYQFPSAE